MNLLKRIFGSKSSHKNDENLSLSFKNWLGQIKINNEISEEVIAFNFGIFESEKGYAIYLTGAKIFDSDDDDWASNLDFEPKEKYFKTDLFPNSDWNYVIREVQGLILEYINSDNFQDSFLSNAKAITTGFDEGDLVRLK